jgi:hypothetical protein
MEIDDIVKFLEDWRFSVDKVYVLHHTHVFADGEEDDKLIGVYATPAEANAAIKRMSAQPGFRDALQGFSVDAYELGKDHWTEGYVTVP